MDPTENFQVCTGCGSDGFACVLGNGNPEDRYNGPYVLCEAAFSDWLKIGDDVLYIHD